MNQDPPRLFLRFFRWYCHPKIVGYIEGDLTEVYQRRLRKSGKRIADLRFIIDVIFLFRPAIVRPVEYQSPTTLGMYGNYFKTAFRNLWKNKGYSFINIMGLAIGMSVALLIGLWIKFQASYNTFHENRDNIAIVMKRTLFNDFKGTQTGVMLPLYDELKSGNYPEVKGATRLDWGGDHALAVGDTRIMKLGHFADPDFLKMFTFPLIKGDINTALNDPYSMLITEALSKDLFGDADPMGKTIILNKSGEMIVTGVLKNVPPNSTMHFDFLVPFEWLVINHDWIKKARTNWGNNFLQTMVELNDGVTPEEFSARIENLLREKSGDPKESTFFVHPMNRWHLYNNFENWVNTGGAIGMLRLFGIVGLLVLGIACINFVNLSTARSEKRAREVGVRKAIGSHRRQLIMQFLSESFLTTMISFLIALLIVQFSLPALSQLGFQDIKLDLTDLTLVSSAIAAVSFTSLLAGWYPALYLSGIKAVSVLKGSFRAGTAANLPRKILVVSQFTFSIALIIATTVIFLQIQYAKGRPLGYNPNNLLHIGLSKDLRDHFDALKQELLATGSVDFVSRSSSPMTSVYNTWDGFSWDGMDPNSHPVFSAIMVDYDYDKTSGLTMMEGRFFDNEHRADSVAVVLNESARKLIGFDDPIGKTIKFNETVLTIIGVNQNVVMENPYEDVPPAAYFLWPGGAEQGFVRLREGITANEAIAAIQPVVDKLNPGIPFDVRFTEDVYKGKFSNENKLGTLAVIFASISVFISCLGLFGLASFMAERRTKEIGIRKVVGASIFNLWRMLSRDFVMLVIVACVIAIPGSYLVMQKWLLSYTYRTDIPWWIPAVTGIAALAITLITVSYQTIRAAKMNPVNSLRSE